MPRRDDPDAEYSPEDDDEWCERHHHAYSIRHGCWHCEIGKVADPPKDPPKRPETIPGVKYIGHGFNVRAKNGRVYGYDTAEHVWYNYETLAPVEARYVPVECRELLARQLIAMTPLEHTDRADCECAGCMVGRP